MLEKCAGFLFVVALVWHDHMHSRILPLLFLDRQDHSLVLWIGVNLTKRFTSISFSFYLTKYTSHILDPAQAL